jgi:hypothetical protein
MQGSVCVKFGVCLQRCTSNAKILNFVLIHEGRAKSPAFFIFTSPWRNGRFAAGPSENVNTQESHA